MVSATARCTGVCMTDLRKDIDEKCHLYGGTRLLNSIAQFVPSGGLGEAASWIFLRQDIYVSLTTGQPLNIDLNNFRESPLFHADTSSAWANKMIFIFAEILNFSCQQDKLPSLERWKELEAQAEAWNNSKPWHFRPLWIREETLPFPEIWMMGPPHGEQIQPIAPTYPAAYRFVHAVVGQQYYSLAKILLGTFDPRLTRLGFGSHKIRKSSEVCTELQHCTDLVTKLWARHQSSNTSGMLLDLRSAMKACRPQRFMRRIYSVHVSRSRNRNSGVELIFGRWILSRK